MNTGIFIIKLRTMKDKGKSTTMIMLDTHNGVFYHSDSIYSSYVQAVSDAKRDYARDGIDRTVTLHLTTDNIPIYRKLYEYRDNRSRIDRNGNIRLFRIFYSSKKTIEFITLAGKALERINKATGIYNYYWGNSD